MVYQMKIVVSFVDDTQDMVVEAPTPDLPNEQAKTQFVSAIVAGWGNSGGVLRNDGTGKLTLYPYQRIKQVDIEVSDISIASAAQVPGPALAALNKKLLEMRTR